MPTLLIRNARCIATCDDGQRELHDASIFIRDGLIEFIGPAADASQQADQVIDARDHLVVPGRVVVRNGRLATLELGPLIERHNALARQLVQTL